MDGFIRMNENKSFKQDFNVIILLILVKFFICIPKEEESSLIWVNLKLVGSAFFCRSQLLYGWRKVQICFPTMMGGPKRDVISV